MRNIAAIVSALLVAGFVVHGANAQSMSYSFAGNGHRADPVVNNYLSARYDHLLQVSPRFRSFRMWKECHIITWPGLRPECIASFDQYEPVLYRAY